MTSEVEAPASTAARWRVPSVAPHRGRPRAPGTAWIWALAAALFVLYSIVSVRTHQRMLSTGFDLGIFEQAVRSYAEGNAPVAEIKGPDFRLLGDHFSPVLALLAPLYRVFPSPITLLLAQSALLAVAVVPLAGWAQRSVGRAAALAVGLGYGLSWGIASAVGFDFHEIAFAVPLMAFCAVALGERRLGATVAWALPLMLIKEDLGLTVAAVGALVFWFGRRRLGIVAILAGFAGSLLEVLVLLPAANADGGFAYWDTLRAGGEDDGGVGRLAERVSVGLVSPEPKAMLLVLLIAPTALLALRSPLLMLALPTLAWRLLSENALYWNTHFHYSAVLMPVVFAAFIDVLRRSAHPLGSVRVREALIAGSIVTAVLLPSYPLWAAVRPSTWQHDVRVDDARAMLRRIPDDGFVYASNRLVPQIANRTQVSVFGWDRARDNPEWIMVDLASPANWPFGSLRGQEELIQQARDLGYQTAAEQGDFLLLHRDPGDARQFPAPPPPPEPLPVTPTS